MSSSLKLRKRLGFRPKSSTNPIVCTGGSIDTVPAFVSTGNKAFDRAFERFFKELSVEEQAVFRKAHQKIDPQSLLAHVKNLDEQDKAHGPRRFLGPVEKMLEILNQLVQSVVIGIQASPDISSLVVGGIKFILDMALKYVDYFRRLAEMIGRLADHLGHLQELVKDGDNSIIQTSTANVYGGVLRFCHEAQFVFRDGLNRPRKFVGLRSWLQVQWEPFQAKFGEIDDDI